MRFNPAVGGVAWFFGRTAVCGARYRTQVCTKILPCRTMCRWKKPEAAAGNRHCGIEPMVNLGRPEVILADDGWTASARDGLPSAHFEHVVAVTDDEPALLTMTEEEIFEGVCTPVDFNDHIGRLRSGLCKSGPFFCATSTRMMPIRHESWSSSGRAAGPVRVRSTLRGKARIRRRSRGCRQPACGASTLYTTTRAPTPRNAGRKRQYAAPSGSSRSCSPNVPGRGLSVYHCARAAGRRSAVCPQTHAYAHASRTNIPSPNPTWREDVRRRNRVGRNSRDVYGGQNRPGWLRRRATRRYGGCVCEESDCRR